jgi:hypothetical protein
VEKLLVILVGGHRGGPVVSTSALPTSRSTSFEIAPRVIPIRSARSLDDISSSPYKHEFAYDDE